LIIRIFDYTVKKIPGNFNIIAEVIIYEAKILKSRTWEVKFWRIPMYLSPYRRESLLNKFGRDFYMMLES